MMLNVTSEEDFGAVVARWDSNLAKASYTVGKVRTAIK